MERQQETPLLDKRISRLIRRSWSLSGVALVMALLALEGCSSVPTTTPGRGRGPLDLDTPIASPPPLVVTTIGAATLEPTVDPPPFVTTVIGAPTLEPTVGPPPIERTARPGSGFHIASPIIPTPMRLGPEAYYTPTPLPPGVTLPPPPMGPLPPLPPGDPNIPRTAPTAPYETPIHVTPVPNGPTLFLPPRRATVTPTVTPTP
ncbi:MAG: hypothetical protein KIT87_24275 [Anaerolineae bacterium]|nr:hypothetical protein [Anaerolineae bacterium]